MAELVDDSGECNVEDLTIGREGYGSIFFPGITDVTNLNFDEIGKASVLFLNSFNSAPWEIFHAFLCLLIFFQNKLFRKIFSGIPSECQTNWIQIRPDILSGLIWVQSVCKGYQQTTLGGKEL